MLTIFFGFYKILDCVNSKQKMIHFEAEFIIPHCSDFYSMVAEIYITNLYLRRD